MSDLVAFRDFDELNGDILWGFILMLSNKSPATTSVESFVLHLQTKTEQSYKMER